MRTNKRNNIVIYTWLIVLSAFMLFGCSNDDDNCECNGQYYSPEDKEYIYHCNVEDVPTGYYFVKCVTDPGY